MAGTFLPVLNDVEKQSLHERQPLPDVYLGLSDDEMELRIAAARAALGDRLVILGHHYQRDEVIKFADYTGDSFKLSREIAKHPAADYIVFCGVHFMAESADILGLPHQQVILPDLAAGCSMADMVAPDQLETCWAELDQMGVASRVMPVTYINSAAAIKSFVGERGGTICTSSNAAATLKWGWNQREKILFLPDQHLGRNTAWKMGVPLDEMVVWDPFEPFGGLTKAELDRARMILWKGHCSVHVRFTAKQIEAVRQQYPGIRVDRASRGAVRRAAGRRRQRLDRIHPENGSRCGAGYDVGRRNGDPSRPSSRRRGGGDEDRDLARSGRLPVLDDVPRVAEPSALGAGRSARRRGPQPHHRAG